MAKVSLSELKKAIQWIEANTNQSNVSVNYSDSAKLILKAFDRGDQEVEITLFDEETGLMPKIKKTTTL